MATIILFTIVELLALVKVQCFEELKNNEIVVPTVYSEIKVKIKLGLTEKEKYWPKKCVRLKDDQRSGFNNLMMS